jgi:histidine ammonia-lyase
MKPLELTGQNLKPADFYDVVLYHRPVHLAAGAIKKMNRSRRVVEKMLAEHRIVYGVTTGFGKLADQKIPEDEIKQLQVNLIRSHACGVGPPLSESQVRGMILLRAQVLTRGHSGVRPVVVERLAEMLNAGLHPVIPSRGSVGASGDLIPLAHLAQLLIGEGEAWIDGRRLSGNRALQKAGITPIILEAKEGLSLVNGTQGALALGLLSLSTAEKLAETADVAGAMSLEALMGTPTAFDLKIQKLRPYPGQMKVAQNIRTLLSKSEIRASHISCSRVQDPYSIRCMPQVHGAVRDAIDYVRQVLSIEMNSVTDNPIVFPEDETILAGGNFHGHPIALALDFLAIALTHLGVISERRVGARGGPGIAQLVDPELIDLPRFLTKRPGLHSGLMMPQVAAAALASECKLLAHPASVDSIPTSANQEDYVSMAMGAGLKLDQIVTNVEGILAVELIAAAQGVEFHAPLKPGKGVARAMEQLRAEVPPLEEDRSLSKEMEKISKIIREGRFCF